MSITQHCPRSMTIDSLDSERSAAGPLEIGARALEMTSKRRFGFDDLPRFTLYLPKFCNFFSSLHVYPAHARLTQPLAVPSTSDLPPPQPRFPFATYDAQASTSIFSSSLASPLPFASAASSFFSSAAGASVLPSSSLSAASSFLSSALSVAAGASALVSDLEPSPLALPEFAMKSCHSSSAHSRREHERTDLGHELRCSICDFELVVSRNALESSDLLHD
jgi:hypothetical protein